VDLFVNCLLVGRFTDLVGRPQRLRETCTRLRFQPPKIKEAQDLA
jgi:hypothetical protein